ncbi:response regulator [Antarcticirhabdus aurantiaca]|uniref:Response regulator transcription factor n=1 Tax=Antarcticirhabdus aurantiaca TaxID=2606717 RepID=A0ACD4NNX2_9HYPH|nr:response regulator transcription factor [Antarcticirhabdus aurantiaca]WAJ28518.1 response regulator transcription factor [Jeongeuplla avenae]
MNRFLIVDDHPLFREALRGAIEAVDPEPDIREAAGIEEAAAVLREEGAEGFDLALLDLSMPGISGFEGVTTLRSRFPSLPILVVSAQSDPRVARQALSYGVSGFVPKSANRAGLARAIADVLAGAVHLADGLEADIAALSPSAAADPGAAGSGLEARLASLTPQQLRVLGMIRQGLLNKQIAFELGVGETTVKAHVSEILRKLGVISRTQAVVETARLDKEIMALAEAGAGVGPTAA